MRCSTCNEFHTDEQHAALERALLDLREKNPQHVFLLSEGAVWLRHDGQEFGIYSATITGHVIYCLDANGRTPLHRAVSEVSHAA